MSEEKEISLEHEISRFKEDFSSLAAELNSVVVGQKAAVNGLLTALFAGGHALVEGPPGLGKSLLARALADAVDGNFRRLQFTSDLMSADVIGTYVVMEVNGRRKFEFQQGPIFTNILLADQINRATPKTQAALLEGLGDGTVTVANETYDLPRPFFAMATQSTENDEGVFPLTATQADRFFFKLDLKFPSIEELSEIIDRTTNVEHKKAEPVIRLDRILEMRRVVKQIATPKDVSRMVALLITNTQPRSGGAPESVQRLVSSGASPRAARALVLGAKVLALLAGRDTVEKADVRSVAPLALRHRLSLNFEGHAEQIDPDTIIADVMKTV